MVRFISDSFGSSGHNLESRRLAIPGVASGNVARSMHTDVQHAISEVISGDILRRPPTEIQQPALVNFDNSGSTFDSGAIVEIKKAIPRFIEEVTSDYAIRSSVLMTWGKFGSHKALEISEPFTSVDELRPPQLNNAGATPLNRRIVESIEVLCAAKNLVQNVLALDQRPAFLVEMTDGSPTDFANEAAARKAIRETAVEHGIIVHLFAVGPMANKAYLDSLTQPGLKVQTLSSETQFAELFKWIGKSLKIFSQSMVGEVVEYPAFDGSLIKSV